MEGRYVDGTRKRMRSSLLVKNEKEAKKILTSNLTKGLKVWIFNTKDFWPLHSASKVRGFRVSGLGSIPRTG